METANRPPAIGRELGAQTPAGRASRARIVEAIRAHYEEHGYAPTQREITRATGIPTSTVEQHLDVLRNLGVVTWTAPC